MVVSNGCCVSVSIALRTFGKTLYLTLPQTNYFDIPFLRPWYMLVGSKLYPNLVSHSHRRNEIFFFCRRGLYMKGFISTDAHKGTRLWCPFGAFTTITQQFLSFKGQLGIGRLVGHRNCRGNRECTEQGNRFWERGSGVCNSQEEKVSPEYKYFLLIWTHQEIKWD